LDAQGLDLVRDKGASLVWCPSSNHFLLGRTLGAEALQAGIPIALGSDSALTAAGDLLDELQIARACGREPDELYRMVTEIPARMLRLPATKDQAVFRDKGGKPSETLLSGDPPEMVIVKGKIKLIAPHLAERMKPMPARYARLILEGRPEVQVAADIANLYKQAQRALGEVHLAGRRVHSS
jgi:cytosine/adenosine deaminase-related metal-dependent hydrolase